MQIQQRAKRGGAMALVEESGRNLQRTALILRDLLTGFPERATLAHDLFLAEQDGDRIDIRCLSIVHHDNNSFTSPP